MRFLRRLLLLLIVLGAIGGGVAWFLAGREPGPQIAISAPEKFVGQKGELTFTIDTPDGKVTALDAAIEQNGQRIALAPDGVIVASGQPHQQITVPLGKAAQPTLVNGAATPQDLGRSRGALWPAHRLDDGDARSDGAPGSPACGGPVAAPFHQPRRRRIRRPSCHAAGRPGGRARGRRRVSRVSRDGGRSGGSGRSRRVLRAAPRPGRQYDDLGLRARRGRQPDVDAGRAPAVPEGVRALEDPDRSAVPGSGRAGHRLGDAGSEGRHILAGWAASGVSRHQRRPAPEECRGHPRAGVEDGAADAMARSVCPDGEHAGGVAVRGSAHLLLRQQGDRQAGAPRLRPRVGPACAGARLEHRRGRLRELPRHLWELRHPGPRARGAVALRAPVFEST